MTKREKQWPEPMSNCNLIGGEFVQKGLTTYDHDIFKIFGTIQAHLFSCFCPGQKSFKKFVKGRYGKLNAEHAGFGQKFRSKLIATGWWGKGGVEEKEELKSSLGSNPVHLFQLRP